jgi:DNA-binding response OmpR family regulator
MRLLIIDHDKKNTNALAQLLRQENFEADIAHDGTHGSYLARINQYDLILMETLLPGKPGCHVCQEMRGAGRATPVIGISSSPDVNERLKLFQAGADDCLTKPYSYRELIARIHAVLRRGRIIDPDCISAGSVVLNRRTQQVKRGNREIRLSQKEYCILELLLVNRGSVLTKAAILEHIWNMENAPLPHAVESQIYKIRKKLGPKDRDLIKANSGRGYFIEA